MNELAGTADLTALLLRRDRVRLAVWVMALVGVTLLSALAVADAYATAEQRRAYAATIGASPVGVATSGPPVALTTIGGILVFETTTVALLGVALMAVLLVVRNTRGDEEEGRTELLGSTVVGRHAQSVAALTVVAAASLLVGAGVAVSVLVAGAGAGGAAVYGAAVASHGIFFGSVALVTAQLVSTGRSASGAALGVLGVSFAARAAGDVSRTWVGWLSPTGWAQRVRAFDDDRWWPVLLLLGAAVGLGIAGLRLASSRDLGAGLLATRPGPAEAGRALAGSVALAARQQRGSLVGWAAGTALIGLVFGAMSEELQELVGSNPTFAAYFAATGGDLADSFLATGLLVVSLIGAAFAVASALRLRQEEVAGRAELLLTAGLGRTRWLVGGLVVTAAGTGVVVLAGGVAMGAAYAVVVGDLAAGAALAGRSTAYLPAVLVLGALAVALFGWLPRLVVLSWGVVAFCGVVGWLGGLLRPPDWVSDLSPWTHLGQVPAEPIAPVPVVVEVVLAALLVTAGVVGLGRRDVS